MRLPSPTLAGALTGLLLIAPGIAAAGNNLHLIPEKGVKYGIVKSNGTKIQVQLEQSKDGYFIDLNNSSLEIKFVEPTDSDAPLVYNSPPGASPFAEVYPNGAYELSDPSHDLLASHGCWQVASNGAWNNQIVLCDVASVRAIQVKTYKGNDQVVVAPSVTVPVNVKCHATTQAACGPNCLTPSDPSDPTWCITDCLTPSDNMCCDTATGCFTAVGGDCATDCPP